MENVQLNEKGMTIIKMLIDETYIFPSKAITANEIFDLVSDTVELAQSSVNRIIKQLVDNDFIQEGLRAGRKKKYYVSHKGIEYYVDYATIGIDKKEQLVLAYMQTLESGKKSWADFYDEVQARYAQQE